MLGLLSVMVADMEVTAVAMAEVGKRPTAAASTTTTNRPATATTRPLTGETIRLFTAKTVGSARTR